MPPGLWFQLTPRQPPGTIPTEVSKASRLEHLALSDNAFTGKSQAALCTGEGLHQGRSASCPLYDRHCTPAAV